MLYFVCYRAYAHNLFNESKCKARIVSFLIKRNDAAIYRQSIKRVFLLTYEKLLGIMLRFYCATEDVDVQKLKKSAWNGKRNNFFFNKLEKAAENQKKMLSHFLHSNQYALCQHFLASNKLWKWIHN